MGMAHGQVFTNRSISFFLVCAYSGLFKNKMTVALHCRKY